jgi:hypothetical protein
MDVIYQKAANVFAWLGLAADNSDLAMAVLGALENSEQVEFPEEVEVAGDAVSRLFSRPYFRRMWIIQEICRASTRWGGRYPPSTLVISSHPCDSCGKVSSSAYMPIRAPAWCLCWSSAGDRRPRIRETSSMLCSRSPGTAVS